jgi:hypothetical protein
MEREEIFRPKLKRQIVAQDNDEAEIKSNTFKKDLSNFFTNLYIEFYGGKVRKELWGKRFNTNKINFSPDIEKFENGRWIYPEVKATSTQSSQIHSPLIQEENNLYEFMSRIEKGENPPPMIEYALFKYGPSSLTGLHKLNNSKLVETLAKAEKKLVILPLNAFLYLAAFSRKDTRNQETSKYGSDSQDYHVLKGSLLTNLLENNKPISRRGGKYPLPDLEGKLCLEDIEVEHSMTPKIEGFYYKPFVVESFPVTRYFIPEEKYSKLTQNLMEHHVEIFEALKIRNLFQEEKDHPDIPF